MCAEAGDHLRRGRVRLDRRDLPLLIRVAREPQTQVPAASDVELISARRPADRCVGCQLRTLFDRQQRVERKGVQRGVGVAEVNHLIVHGDRHGRQVTDAAHRRQQQAQPQCHDDDETGCHCRGINDRQCDQLQQRGDHERARSCCEPFVSRTAVLGSVRDRYGAGTARHVLPPTVRRTARDAYTAGLYL